MKYQEFELSSLMLTKFELLSFTKKNSKIIEEFGEKR